MAEGRKIEERQESLKQCLADNQSALYVEGLLDAVLAVYNDCDHPTLHRNKNLETFLKRFKHAIPTITANRLSTNDFHVLQVIGRGAFGEVQLVRMKENKHLYAMKILSKYEMIRRSDTAFFWEEHDIMAFTNSQWIVQLHYAFQDKDNLYMVMDYMPGGNMVSLMERYEIPESWVQFYIAELVLALDAVHKMGYVHRDVKPENMLMDARGHLKLADFGTCMKLDENGKVRSETAVGTPDYISPEVLKSQGGEGYYGVECDWWSVGVVAYEMLIGDLPFFSESLMGTYSNIMNHRNTLQFKDENITVSARKLITQLLEDSDHRLRINEIKSHTFFKTDQWTWSNIHSCLPPFKPELVSETDTQYFDEIEDSTSQQQGFASPVEFQGNHLPFVGFTFQKDKNILDDLSVSSPDGNSPSTTASDNVQPPPPELVEAHQELQKSHSLLETKLRMAQEDLVEMKKSLAKTNQNLNEVTKDLGIARIDFKEAKRINEELEEAKRMIEQRNSALQAQLEQNEGVESPTKLLSELEVVRKQLQCEVEGVASLKGQNKELRKDLSIQKSLVEKLEERCHSVASDKEQLESALEDLKSQASKDRAELEAKNTELAKQVKEHEESISGMVLKLAESMEDCQSVKKMQAEAEMSNVVLKNSLQTLQQKYDTLAKNHEQIVLKSSDEKVKTSSTKEYEEMASKLKEESYNRQKAEETISSLQSKISLFELDLKHKQEEVATVQARNKEIEAKLEVETRRRQDHEQSLKRLEEEYKTKLSQREHELKSQMNEMKTEKQKMQHAIYRLESETKLSDQSLKEARQELEEEQKKRNALKGQICELQNKNDGESEKELARLRKELSDLNNKFNHATQAKAMAESKLADFEKEKMMIELDVKETIARHKTEVTERMAWASKIKEQLMIAETKLAQKNNENEQLQENLRKSLTRLNEYIQAEDTNEEEIKRLRHQLDTERVLKKEAVNKLTQVMFQRQPQGKGGNTSQRPAPRQSHEREIRKLKGELQQETQKCKRVVEKYQQQLEEIQRQIIEETQLRKELQSQLQVSEGRLQTLQQGIGSGNYVLNGPSVEPDGLGASGSSFLPIVERETLYMQVPKGIDARKKGWRDVFVVLSHVARKLVLYDREEDMGTDATPHLQLEFDQIYSVRTLEQGEHERVRVKPNDAKRVLQLAYEEGAITSRVNAADEFDGVIHIRGHHFVEVRNSSRSSCDVCGKTLPLALITGGIYECKGCQMKCHKDDIEKVDLIQPCVAGEENQKKLLLLIKNDEDRSFWLNKLKTVTAGTASSIASVSSTGSRTGSPGLLPSSKHRDRGGSMRFANKRPGSAQPKGTPTGGGGAPSRTQSVSQHRRQLSRDSNNGSGLNRQLDLVRSMDTDNPRSQ